MYKILRLITLVVALNVLSASLSFAQPHFRVSPRNIENDIRGMNQTRDTLVITNAEGNEELVWQMEVRLLGEPDDTAWVIANPLEGRIAAGRQAISIVRMNGRNLPDGHYYADLYFTSNDPNRGEWTVPVAGHRDVYPRIEVNWAVPQQGEWWGIDLDRAIGNMFWGETYTQNFTLRNRGTGELVVDSLVCQTAYFTFNPSRFSLAAGGNRAVQLQFRADEVGANSTSVTSISNVWDPRELSFRIVGTVNPVFRIGSRIPDIEIDEDAPELLVADLDTVFVTSYGDTRYDITGGIGFTNRLARNREFFIRPRANWNGESVFHLNAAVGDSLSLADTFSVRVRPIPDPPGQFDLILPADEDTIWFDRGDSLFVWQNAIDPDGDAVKYTLMVIKPDGDTLFWRDIPDTFYSTAEVFGNEQLNGLVEWTVVASDGELTRNAWSMFNMYLVDGRQSVDFSSVLPDKFDVTLYPNPTNSMLNITVNLDHSGLLSAVLYSLNGRLISRIANGWYLSGTHRFQFDFNDLPSGSYLLDVKSGARQSLVQSVQLLR